VKLMCVGAHPDDCDLRAGGLAAITIDRGGEALFVSVTNGNAGHHEMAPAALAARRKEEARRAGAVIGAEYLVLDHDDGRLTASLEVREELIGIIRRFGPDLLLGPRPFDYHADHRAAGQLVMDASFLLTVPLIRPDVPAMRQMPVICYTADRFTQPLPFRPNVVVDIDAQMDRKVRMIACHESQVYEWLPWHAGTLDKVPADPQARFRMVSERYGERSARISDSYRPMLIERYGPERGARVRHAEAFEVCEYGRRPDAELLAQLFPD
jgi:LmbE family N-acetylglucosaminyl deacetylase